MFGSRHFHALKNDRSVGRHIFFHFFHIFNFFYTKPRGKPKKNGKRLAWFVSWFRTISYITNRKKKKKKKKKPAKNWFIKLTCRLSFTFEANDPTSWMTSNSIIHLSIKQSNIGYWFYCGRVYFFIVTINSHSGITKKKIVSIF